MKPIAFISLLISFFIISCGQPAEQQKVEPQQIPENPYLTEYAGTYEIMVKDYPGVDSERFILLSTGKATWKWTYNGTTTTKTGFWEPSEGIIETKIYGNSGPITETYRLKNGRWVSDTSSDRYLVKK